MLAVWTLLSVIGVPQPNDYAIMKTRFKVLFLVAISHCCWAYGSVMTCLHVATFCMTKLSSTVTRSYGMQT